MRYTVHDTQYTQCCTREEPNREEPNPVPTPPTPFFSFFFFSSVPILHQAQPVP